jgi:DNA-binding MarR family transcriptional regulator
MIDETVFEDFVAEVRSTFFSLRAVADGLHADLGCSAVERGVLQELDRVGPTPVPTLARSRAVSRQAMQKTVDRMLEHGWVETVANPNHQRSPLVAITAAGDKLQRTTRSRERALLSSAPVPVTAAELERATATLARMRSFLATTGAAEAR